MFSGSIFLLKFSMNHHHHPLLVLLLRNFMFLPLMTAMLIARSLNACSKSLLAKVTTSHLVSSTWVFFECLICLRFWLDYWVCWFWKFAVTVVDSGTRALQYLGLDGEDNSIGFNVRISKFGIQVCIFCNFIVYWLKLGLPCYLIDWWLWWLQSAKVNLIMTDYSMPGMTGYELLKKIKVGSCFFFHKVLFFFVLSYEESIWIGVKLITNLCPYRVLFSAGVIYF